MTRFWMFLAWKMPRQLVYWCAVRLMAHATFVHSSTIVDQLSPADCLKAWSNR